jgi:hypothetical protein
MPLVAFCLRHFLADFIICMCEFDFRQAQDTARAWRAHALIAKRAIDLQEERLMLSVAGIEPLRNFLLDLLTGR